MPVPQQHVRHVVPALVLIAALLLTACGASSRTGRAVPPPARSPGATAVSTSAPAAVLAAPARTVAGTPAATTAAATTAAATPTPPPAPNPCAGNTRAQLVTVRIAVQHLWMCAYDRLVRSTPITSGIPGGYTSTPTGTFTVQARTRNTTLTLLDGHTYDVRYWIPFQGPLFGFHDSSWQDFAYGSARYRTDGSHGCVHMPLAAIAFLYHWAHVGATVRIRA